MKDRDLPWIRVAPDAPYFVTEEGDNWTPIGQNDAITWPDLTGAFRRRDWPRVDAYFSGLAAHGVTCLRLMLEYCQAPGRYLENPVGVFQPAVVRLWDDLFSLCRQHGLRMLLTPFDTYWMRRRWVRHPYHRANGGPGRNKSQWLLDPRMRAATKARLAFATRRWGSSGALFAWDLWNEIAPTHAGGDCAALYDWVDEVGTYLRELETTLHGRAHPQTVSVYGPLLRKHPALNGLIFRHPALDFASVHFYDAPIRQPTDSVRPARRVGKLTQQALAQIGDGRPFLDTEHGPDRLFHQKKGRINEAFDDEYFRRLQWAHLASGGVGGGFRWPYRHPHSLTAGMREAQRILAAFVREVDWQRFPRQNLSGRIRVTPRGFRAMACGNRRQVIAWVLPTDAPNGRSTLDAVKLQLITLILSEMDAGVYRIRVWNTFDGQLLLDTGRTLPVNGPLRVPMPLVRTDAVVLIERLTG